MFEDNRICRTCLTTDKELLSISALIEDDDSRIIDYFNECLSYKIIEGDSLPQTICLSCLDNILEVRKFYLQCINSESYLKQQIFESDKIKNEELFITRTESPMVATAIKEEYSEIEALNDDDEVVAGDVIEFEMLDTISGEVDGAPTETEQQEEATEIYDGNYYRCDKCSETFKYEKNYKLHMKIEHGLSKDEIETTIQNLNTREEQQNDYDDDNNDDDDDGDDVSVDKDKQQERISTSKKFQCQLCDYSFNSSRNLTSHMEFHNMINTNRKTTEINFTKHTCSVCHQGFRTRDEMRSHIKIIHRNRNKSLLCPYCGIKSTSTKSIGLHIEKYHESKKTKAQFKCRFCDKILTRKESILAHERNHTGERPYKCTYCDKTFGQRNSLKTHLKLHTGKTVPCPLCDKKFCRQGFLKIHMREHTDERPYVCNLCPKAYRQLTHLKSHQLVHFNERPFKCEHCDRSFVQKSTLRHHMYLHTGKPYQCPSCSLEFSRLYRFRNHLVQIHGIHDDPRLYKRNLESNIITIEEK